MKQCKYFEGLRVRFFKLQKQSGGWVYMRRIDEHGALDIAAYHAENASFPAAVVEVIGDKVEVVYKTEAASKFVDSEIIADFNSNHNRGRN